MRTEGPHQGFLVATSIDGHRAEPLAGSELYAQMTETADTMDRNQIARPRATVAQCVEGGDAGAQQRCGFHRIQPVRHAHHRRGECQHMGGIAAITRNAGRALHVLAGEGVAAPAVATIAAIAGRPADPDPGANGETLDVGTEGVDHADDLMTGDARIGDAGECALDCHGVAVTDAAGLDANADLVMAGLRQVTFDHAKAGVGFRDDHRAHLCHGYLHRGPERYGLGA